MVEDNHEDRSTMTELVRISGATLRARLVGKTLSDIDRKEKPQLFWIAISALRVDERYQRKIIGRTSEKSVLSIAEHFSWAKFAPVIVAEVSGADGLYAIIDGQHRTTAAALRGIRDVPCLVMKADFAEQANAFAAINGSVTAISTMQLYHARVAAGEADATAFKEACDEAGVTVCRYPVAAKDMTVGQTVSPARLETQLKRYGRATFVAALRCITKTTDGNIGMVRAPVVEALCTVLNGEPTWGGSDERLIAAMQTFDFFEAYAQARVRALEERCGVHVPLVEIIGEHLEKAFVTQQ
ncbi:ParB N-terminal domain-containing protein [Bradyrhizobium sp. Pear76]|uniref:DUF6551 family protein n=1 Tax=Bradyrhizobium oropedii TaxID=1571201 RepID=UPI001E3A259A|nr:DUF6551 family protein [Bradyrhizobium oropedii]MCC8963735.1 ParB N-terminal domain-containing protein [Bradyrhizobium oropedii]